MKKAKIVFNRGKIPAIKAARAIEKLLVRKGFAISGRPDFVLALGGDGTMLAAAAKYGKKGIPILGINLGGLGFLTDVTSNRLPAILSNIRNGKFRIEKRMVLRAAFGDSVLNALNDLTISTSVPGRVVEFTSTIDGEYICRFVADGIIIASPTGSTAYSLATGGPILLPHTEAIILTPIAPHTLSVRPLVLPATSKVDIEIGQKGKAILVADGQRSKEIKNGQSIRFERADYYIKLIKPLNATFFNTLKEKMKWGGREDA